NAARSLLSSRADRLTSVGCAAAAPSSAAIATSEVTTAPRETARVPGRPRMPTTRRRLRSAMTKAASGPKTASTTSAPSGLTKVMQALVTATRLGQSRVSARLSGAFRALRQLVLAALELVQRVLEVEARVGIRIVERHRVAEVPDRIRKECRRERRVANGEGEVEDSEQIRRLRPPGMIVSGLLDVRQRNLRLGAE